MSERRKSLVPSYKAFRIGILTVGALCFVLIVETSSLGESCTTFYVGPDQRSFLSQCKPRGLSDPLVAVAAFGLAVALLGDLTELTIGTVSVKRKIDEAVGEIRQDIASLELNVLTASNATSRVDSSIQVVLADTQHKLVDDILSALEGRTNDCSASSAQENSPLLDFLSVLGLAEETIIGVTRAVDLSNSLILAAADPGEVDSAVQLLQRMKVRVNGSQMSMIQVAESAVEMSEPIARLERSMGLAERLRSSIQDHGLAIMDHEYLNRVVIDMRECLDEVSAMLDSAQ